MGATVKIITATKKPLTTKTSTGDSTARDVTIPSFRSSLHGLPTPEMAGQNPLLLLHVNCDIPADDMMLLHKTLCVSITLPAFNVAARGA